MIAERSLRRPRRSPNQGHPRARARVRITRLRLAVALAALAALLAGAWLWFRDSALVAVERVTVTGESGSDASQIRSTLIRAARQMTTLDVDVNKLERAVVRFPVVKGLRVSTQFPHGLRIRVIQQVPVGAVDVNGRAVAVAADGTLLHGLTPSTTLPLIPLRFTSVGTRLTDRSALAAVGLLAAAPYQLLARLTQVSTVPAHGLTAQVRGGPSIYFGDTDRLSAKWIAASEVLGDSSSAGAVYIDVTDPEHPVAGAGSGSPSTATGAGGGSPSAPAGAGAGTAANGG